MSPPALRQGRLPANNTLPIGNASPAGNAHPASVDDNIAPAGTVKTEAIAPAGTLQTEADGITIPAGDVSTCADIARGGAVRINVFIGGAAGYATPKARRPAGTGKKKKQQGH